MRNWKTWALAFVAVGDASYTDGADTLRRLV